MARVQKKFIAALLVFLCVFYSFSILGQTKPSTAREWLIEARTQEAAGNLAGAEIALKSALAIIPKGSSFVGQVSFLQNELSVVLRKAGHVDKALAVAKEARSTLSEDSHPSALSASIHFNLGLALRDAKLFRKAIQVFSNAADDAVVTGSPQIENAALLAKGTAELALGLHKTSEATFEALLAKTDFKGADRQRALSALANTYLARRQPVDAGHILKQMNEDAPDISILQATFLLQMGDVTSAERLLRETLENDPTKADEAHSFYSLAEIAFQKGQYPESDELNFKAFDLAQDAFGENSVLAAQALHRRGLILQQVGDFAGALIALERAANLLQELLGREHPLVGQTLIEKTRTLTSLGRNREAADLARMVVDSKTFQTQETGATEVLARAGLGFALKEMGDISGAVAAFELSMQARSSATFSELDAPPGLLALAELYLAEGSQSAAFALATEALDILANAGFENKIELAGKARMILAEIHLQRGAVENAQHLIDSNMQAISQRLIELSRVSSYTSDFAPVEMRAQIEQALMLGRTQGDLGSLFEVAQLVHLNEVAKATNGVIRNSGGDDPTVNSLFVRLEQAQEELTLLTQNPPTIGSNTSQRIGALREEIENVETRLRVRAPELLHQLRPKATPLAQLQSVLSPDEAVWLQMTGNICSTLFLVRSDQVKMHQTDLSEAELNLAVAKLRETLDQSENEGLVPFDFETAADLYQGLLGPFNLDLKVIQTLILVPDGAARQLSFSALLPDAETGEHAVEDRNFLGLSHSLLVSPSLSQFVELREAGQVDWETNKGFIGFGDPVFSPRKADSPTRAFVGLQQVNRAADIGQAFGALPETRREIEAMSIQLADGAKQFFFGPQANETAFKLLDGEEVSTIVFATHAVVSGDFHFLNEPALILSAPREFTGHDDGLLTASEIAKMDLKADLVILSACNTGAPSGRFGASGLSGLARGFFNAGAKSLVVSHWTINSASSLGIMPTFFNELSGNDRTAHARAMKSAMKYVAIELTNQTGNPAFAHPAIWAPFMVIGGA